LAINSAVELGYNFTEKIGQFYRSSVIGLTLCFVFFFLSNYSLFRHFKLLIWSKIFSIIHLSFYAASVCWELYIYLWVYYHFY